MISKGSRKLFNDRSQAISYRERVSLLEQDPSTPLQIIRLLHVICFLDSYNIMIEIHDVMIDARDPDIIT